MLLKALHCRRLSLASHTAAFLMWQSDWIKPCTDTVWYLSDYVLLHHPRGWLCMNFSAVKLLTPSHLFLIQPSLWSLITEKLLFHGCWLYTHLCSQISDGQVVLEHAQVQHCWWPTVTLGTVPDAGQPWDAGSCFSPSSAKWCLLSSLPANKCEMVFVFFYLVW